VRGKVSPHRYPSVFQWGPVVPVVLHGILVRAGGTARWDQRDRGAQRDADRTGRDHGGPTGSPFGPTKSLQYFLQYHRYPRPHPLAGLLSSGMKNAFNQ
jgi:hypothetical protein